MTVHFQRELENLKKRLLSLCSAVEDQVRLAIRALLERDPEMAQAVGRRDVEIDDQEVTLEEECLKVLALHQPVANDLRLIIAVLKINNDLERIGDLAVNIARKATALADGPPVELVFDVAGMWEKTQAMLRDSLDALVNLDVALANDVCGRDDEVDRMKRVCRRAVEEKIRQDPQQMQRLLRLLAASRNLERIADLATNIAEDVIYLVEGKIVRHGEGISPDLRAVDQSKDAQATGPSAGT